MKPKYNAFLTYWPWLLPIGVVIGAAGLAVGAAGVLSGYWTGFCLGLGVVLALVGAGMLAVRLLKNARK